MEKAANARPPARAPDPSAPAADDGARPDPTASTRGILGTGLPFALRRRAASAPVADRVERHWVTQWALPDGEHHVQEVLPHPCVNLVTYGGAVRVHGIPLRRDARRLSGRGAAVGTKFRPGAFAALCRVPMTALRGSALTLTDAFGPAGERLEAELLASAGAGVPGADAIARMIDVVEAFLASRAPAVDPVYALVREIARDMLGRHPDVRVATIARDHGISERTLQRLFREQVGVGPKWVLRRYRLHAAAERIGTEGAHDLASLAAELGYADQAHLANDFRDAVGCSPTAYAAACGHG